MIKDEDTFVASRRRLLEFALVWGAASTLFGARIARAQKTSKENALYQDKPNNGLQCSACKFFIPPQAGAKTGTCKFVEGEISPNGWCMFFNPKG
jgi:hypothetical protein